MSLNVVLEELSALRVELANAKIELGKHRVAASEIYASAAHLVQEIVQAARNNKIPISEIKVPHGAQLSFSEESSVAKEALSISRMVVATISASKGSVDGESVKAVMDAIKSIRDAAKTEDSAPVTKLVANISAPLRVRAQHRPTTPPTNQTNAKPTARVEPVKSLTPQRRASPDRPSSSEGSSHRSPQNHLTFLSEGQAKRLEAEKAALAGKSKEVKENRVHTDRPIADNREQRQQGNSPREYEPVVGLPKSLK